MLIHTHQTQTKTHTNQIFIYSPLKTYVSFSLSLKAHCRRSTADSPEVMTGELQSLNHHHQHGHDLLSLFSGQIWPESQVTDVAFPAAFLYRRVPFSSFVSPLARRGWLSASSSQTQNHCRLENGQI